MPRPHGHECERRNICFDCQGRLRLRRSDSFSEIMYDDGQRAFAAAVCALCKLVHTELEKNLMPIDYDKRIEQLREAWARSQANYLVGLWHKVVQRDNQLIERRYALRLDGTIVTRLDTCDLRRSFNSFEGDGWHEHPYKGSETAIRARFKDVGAKLEEQGYRRLI